MIPEVFCHFQLREPELSSVPVERYIQMGRIHKKIKGSFK